MLQASCPGGMENESQKPQRNTSGRRADTYLGPGQNPNRLQPTTTCNPATKGASPSQHRLVSHPPAALRLSAAASVTRQPQPTRYICHCERSAAIPSPRHTPLVVNPSTHYLCLSLRECLVHSRQSRRSMGGVTHHQSRHRVGANSHSPRPHRPQTRPTTITHPIGTYPHQGASSIMGSVHHHQTQARRFLSLARSDHNSGKYDRAANALARAASHAATSALFHCALLRRPTRRKLTNTLFMLADAGQISNGGVRIFRSIYRLPDQLATADTRPTAASVPPRPQSCRSVDPCGGGSHRRPSHVGTRPPQPSAPADPPRPACRRSSPCRITRRQPRPTTW